VIIESSAPTRIDLAGGTIDIWPLYLFHPGALTLNVAINLYAVTRVALKGDPSITICSVDQKLEAKAPDLSALGSPPGLELIVEALRFFGHHHGMEIMTHSSAPAGGGLGGSSALLISTLAALNRLTEKPYHPEELISLARDLESRVLGVPAGVQDYYAAVFGGVNAIWLRPHKIELEKIDIDLEELRERMLLVYLGKPRFSGKPNWRIVKRHIDENYGIFDIFERIRDISQKMREAFVQRDWGGIGNLLIQEWENRKALSPAPWYRRIDQLFELVVPHGGVAVRSCGAVGGGCILFWVEKGSKLLIKELLQENGVRPIDFEPSSRGLEVRVIE